MSREARPPAFTAIQAEVGRRMTWARSLVEPNRAEFARLCGVDASTLAKCEDGSRAPSIFLIRDYANRLRVSTDFLLFGTLIGIEPELERLLIAHHPELVLAPPDKGTSLPDTAPADGTFGQPTKPKRAGAGGC
jgi:transcriptional regulator with XRE-family HTH domain